MKSLTEYLSLNFSATAKQSADTQKLEQELLDLQIMNQGKDHLIQRGAKRVS
jgi:hypothetical protein